MNIIETLTNPPVAVVTTGGVGLANVLIASLPVIINILTVIYLAGLVIHKGMQIYKELKHKKELKDAGSE